MRSFSGFKKKHLQKEYEYFHLFQYTSKEIHSKNASILLCIRMRILY